MPFFIPQYDLLLIHYMMLSDSTRIQAYQEAIESNVRQGDVVLDVGTGTGILALFAAKAGARKVYAVEPTGIIDLARRIAEKNGIDSRIEFIQAKVEDIDIPEKVDCIVSEWLGLFALQENMLPSIALARERFLKPEGTMLPEMVSLFLCLLEDTELYERKISRWAQQPYGFDFADFASCQSNDMHSDAVASDNLLSDSVRILDIDMRLATNSNFSSEKRLRTKRAGTCHGLAGWFQALFPGGAVLDTAPDQPPTHWNQAFFPIAQPIEVRQDEETTVRLATEADNALVHFIWEINFPDSGMLASVGDTRKVKFIP